MSGLFGISVPSFSDVKNAVVGAGSSALNTAENLGSSALSEAKNLGRQGADLGRSALSEAGVLANKADHAIQSAGTSAVKAIGQAQSWAEHGISSGVSAASNGVHDAADYARSHITGSDPISRLARGAITVTEDQTRFDIGLVGGVSNAAVGLVGSVGQLSVLSTEYQLSPSARGQIDQALGAKATSAFTSASNYLDSVAQNPSRLLSDAQGAASSAGAWLQDQAAHPEKAGMTVGNVATYLIPVGGEARAVAGVGELATRGTVSALAEDGTRALTETGTRALAEDGTRATVETGAGTAAAAAPEISDVARAAIPEAAQRTGLSESQITSILEEPKGMRPSPDTYLSPTYTSSHLAQWNDGAVRFTSRASFEARGTLGPPQGFTIPASEFNALVKETGGDIGKIEQKLGLDPGYLSNPDTMIVHVERPNISNLHVPSGNESGANPHWLPGGYTSGGEPEAVMDFPKGTPYTEIHLNPAGE